MPLFTWNPEYSVNVANLDAHHQKLFHIINAVYKNVTSPEMASILPMLDELSAYTDYHFKEEEQFMREKGFPELEYHRALHREFTHKVATLRETYHHNDLDVSGELIILLGKWLLQHVHKEDRKYAAVIPVPD